MRKVLTLIIVILVSLPNISWGNDNLRPALISQQKQQDAVAVDEFLNKIKPG